MRRVLIASRVSAHHFFDFSDVGKVFSDRLVVIALESYSAFSLLSSTIHDAWAHRPGTTTHETRSTYFPEAAFETFPFPRQCSSDLDKIGVEYHSKRRQIMLARQEGLTKAYNRFHDQEETSADIQELRQLHVGMDQAVATAYGWTDLNLGHGFHQMKQGLRYTISEPARREVLARLLKLNHERYAEEVRQGLHEKKKPKGTRAKAKPAQKADSTRTLFE
jgi:hypothetical protein